MKRILGKHALEHLLSALHVPAQLCALTHTGFTTWSFLVNTWFSAGNHRIVLVTVQMLILSVPMDTSIHSICLSKNYFFTVFP